MWLQVKARRALPARQSQIANQNGAAPGFEICSADSAFGAGGPNQKRLESSTV